MGLKIASSAWLRICPSPFPIFPLRPVTDTKPHMNQKPHKGTRSGNDHTDHGLQEQLEMMVITPVHAKGTPRAQSSISPTMPPSWAQGVVRGVLARPKQGVESSHQTIQLAIDLDWSLLSPLLGQSSQPMGRLETWSFKETIGSCPQRHYEL